MYTKENVRQKESSWRNVIIAVAEWKIAVSYMREHMHTKHMMRTHLAAYALSWGLSVEVQQPYVHSENDVILQLHQQKSKEIGVLQYIKVEAQICTQSNRKTLAVERKYKWEEWRENQQKSYHFVSSLATAWAMSSMTSAPPFGSHISSFSCRR